MRVPVNSENLNIMLLRLQSLGADPKKKDEGRDGNLIIPGMPDIIHGLLGRRRPGSEESVDAVVQDIRKYADVVHAYYLRYGYLFKRRDGVMDPDPAGAMAAIFKLEASIRKILDAPVDTRLAEIDSILFWKGRNSKAFEDSGSCFHFTYAEINYEIPSVISHIAAMVKNYKQILNVKSY